MADTKTRALTGPRQLKLMVPEYTGTYAAPDGFPSYKGWSPVLGFGAPGGAVYYEGKINCNLSLDDLTMYPEAIFLQDPGIYLRTPAVSPEATRNDLMVLDLVSVKQLDIQQIVSNMDQDNNAPGMLMSDDEFSQILMGTFRLMAFNNTFPTATAIQTTVETKDFSSATPFATDFLWCYRILIPRTTALGADELGCPASRFILQVVSGKEDLLPYMMRLKNSYELQQL